MTEDFFNFIIDTTKENFTQSQKIVFADKEYDPYSKDLEIIEDFLDKNEFQKVATYNNINTLLSPRAHFYKNYALEKLDKQKDSKSELIFGQKILEGICATGDGSIENPYVVTRISDERDVLSYLQEEHINQVLVKENGKFYDLLNCKSRNKIYFDITVPYMKMKELVDSKKMDFSTSFKKYNKSTDKKWWKFW